MITMTLKIMMIITNYKTLLSPPLNPSVRIEAIIHNHNSEPDHSIDPTPAQWESSKASEILNPSVIHNYSHYLLK